jgi:hypothetical protein
VTTFSRAGISQPGFFARISILNTDVSFFATSILLTGGPIFKTAELSISAAVLFAVGSA